MSGTGEIFISGAGLLPHACRDSPEIIWMPQTV